MYMHILNFTYPLRCLRVPPVEYHCPSVTDQVKPMALGLMEYMTLALTDIPWTVDGYSGD
jgi:hypothetical protein